MKLLNRADVVAAGHTLWQAALGSGGFEIAYDSVTKHGLHLSSVEQGLGVVGVAVVSSLASLVKGYVLQWRAGRSGVVAEVIDAVADAVPAEPAKPAEPSAA